LKLKDLVENTTGTWMSLAPTWLLSDSTTQT
jgi:hypothetical protein